MVLDALGLLGVVLGYWALVAVGCRPVLTIDPLRTKLATAPTDSERGNYLLLTAAVTGVHAVAFLGIITALGPLEGGDVFGWFVRTGALAALASWLFGAVALPAVDRWALSTRDRLWLALAAVWYVAVTVVAVIVGTVLLIAITFPG